MPKKRNEATSKRVASIAGKVLEALKEADLDGWVQCEGSKGGPTVWPCTARELQALAASALTQREPSDEGVHCDRAQIALNKKRNTHKRKPARKGRK